MNLMVIGLGEVAKNFISIFKSKTEKIQSIFKKNKIVCVVDSRGFAFSDNGLDPDTILLVKELQRTISKYPVYGKEYASLETVLELINNQHVDLIVESTPQNIKSGEPALSFIKAALSNGKHVITTNKAPLALRFRELKELAEKNNVFLRFSGTIGGGIPILELIERGLTLNDIFEIKTMLNTCTSVLLENMFKHDVTFDKALEIAQSMVPFRITEKDPSLDIDGYDQACKIAIIHNIAFGNREVTLRDVKIGRSVREVTLDEVAEVKKSNMEIRQIGKISESELEVTLENVPAYSYLCTRGCQNAILFSTKYLDTVMLRGSSGPRESAYAAFRDLCAIVKDEET